MITSNASIDSSGEGTGSASCNFWYSNDLDLQNGRPFVLSVLGGDDSRLSHTKGRRWAAVCLRKLPYVQAEIDLRGTRNDIQQLC